MESESLEFEVLDWGFPAGADATERFSVVRIAHSITQLQILTGV